MKKLVLNIFLLCIPIIVFGQENCNNGIDDDGDGLIDLNDPDCVCSSSSPNFISNHDFEQLIYCPFDFAQFDAVSNWFMPSSATSDYINSCDFVPVSALNAGVYPLPTSNGNGVAGILVSQDYKEFIGICTNTPLLAGTTYQLNFDIASSTSGRILSTSPNTGSVCNDGILNAGKIDITLYGRSYCNTTTPPNTNNFPAGWQPLGTATYLPSKNWNQLSILFTPTTNINSIMIGSPYTLPNTYVNEIGYLSCFPYFYLDNIILDNASNLGVNISQTGSFCDNTLVLTAEIDSSIGSGYSYQWYKDGIAIVGSTSISLPINNQTNNIGNYRVKITNSSSCKISPYINVNTVFDVPDYSINQSHCFPGITTVSITTEADEYSFDNGVTWSTNPIKENLTALFNPIRILVKKNGCISNTRFLVLTYPPIETVYTQPEVEVVQAGCQTNGSITVTTPALEYSFDGGNTWTTNPTIIILPTDPYHVYSVRIKTLLGCISIPRGVIMHSFRLPEPTYEKTNVFCGIGGSITFTTLAQEYSINGGATWSTSPVFTNLNVGTYNLIIKNEFNCISFIEVAYIVTDNLQKPQVSFTQPECGVLGTITVLTSAAEYSFDDGVTWSTNNIATNLTSGYYRVKVKDSQNCTSLAETVYIQAFQLDIDIEFTITNSSCTNNGSITISTVAQQYSIDSGLTWTSNPIFTNLSSGSYFIKVRNGLNCESTTMYVDLYDFTDISPNYQITDAGCNSYGNITITTVADFYSFDNGITWSVNNIISNLSGASTFILLVKNDNCISQGISVDFNSNYISNPIVNDFDAYVCDSNNNQIESVNLTDYNSNISENDTNHDFYYFTNLIDAQNLNFINQIQNVNNFEITSGSFVYALVESSENCYSIAEIYFTLLLSPSINSIPNDIILCENNTVTVSAGTNFDSYLWSTGESSNSILIDQPGNYSVTVTHEYFNQTCSVTKDFNVNLSSPANITSITTEDFTDSNNVIEVNVTGYGNYEYSVDGILYQDSTIFNNLESGIYTVYIRDKNNCGIVTDEVFLLMYPKFFTPNDDGYNDTWKINFSEFEAELVVSIFDRYGKLLKVLNQSSAWDGKFNGTNIPSDDYWFVVKRKSGKEYRNHFTLKR